MGRTNGKTLVEEERKYSCLWDEWDKGYKEKDRKVNARNAIVEDTGKVAEVII